MRGILNEGGIHDTADADISSLVGVDQLAANCLQEAVQSFTVMQSISSRADVSFCRPLSVFRAVRCSSVHCFQTRITVELFRCQRIAVAQ